jgi:predicted lipoprotein with Yx(FWY)xxD motif
MKRSLILGGLVVVILAAVAVVAIADSGSGGSSSTASSGGSGGIYGSPAPSATPKAPAAPKPASGDVGVSVASHGVGPMLVDGSGRTLYLWKADTGMQSTCSGACAQAWPPLTTMGSVRAGHGVEAKLLGMSKRSDGSSQVTYAGHPLYLFAGDTAAGQLNGQGSNGFGADWWAVTPGGAAITQAG